MGPPLTAGRAQAETAFEDECVITRPGTGESVRDETTGTTTPPAPTAIYDGACMFRPPSTTTSNQPTQQGGAPAFIEDMRCRIPATQTGVRLGDTVTCTASSTDPSQVGRQFDVTRIIAGTYAVTRILILADKARGPRV